MRSVLVGVGLAIVISVASVPALAQQGTSEITGRALDEQGAALPGVAIVATNEDNGQFREATTSAEGVYHLAQMVPGRYAIVAKLTGFRTFERRGLVVAVGTTLTVNLTMAIGALEESVTVTGNSPIIDLTATDVGGNIGTGELAELPAMNRNYFATVALLPGVQFSPSTQMGNDTIVSNGQSSQNNNVSVDGGYNGDNALGTSSGAQVRTPLEAIQEFEVITSMYDAEYGRAGGAIVNAVTKTGTNKFTGVLFGYAVSNQLTSKDFFARQRSLPKAQVEKREWGFVVGGPIIRNKAHFFVSLERQVDKPSRTRSFLSRPENDFSIVEDRNDWNTLVRFDHQITANHTWAVRWLRETAPQFPVVPNRASGPDVFQDETDLDQTAVGTFTSVLGGTKVNTFRVAKTWEHWWHGNAVYARARIRGRQRGLQVRRRSGQRHDAVRPAAQLPRADRGRQHRIAGPVGHQLPDRGQLLVVRAREEGRPQHQGRRTLHLYQAAPRVADQPERHVQLQHRPAVRSGQSPHLPRAAGDSHPERLRRDHDQPHLRGVRAGQVAAQRQHDVEPRACATTSSSTRRSTRPTTRCSSRARRRPSTRTTSRPASASRISWTTTASRSCGPATASSTTARFSAPSTTPSSSRSSPRRSSPTSRTTTPIRGPSRGQFPTDPFLVNGPFVNRALLNQLFPPGTAPRNTGVVIFDSPDRRQPYAHQMTLGYVRELHPTLAFHADYVRIMNRDMFLATQSAAPGPSQHDAHRRHHTRRRLRHLRR